MVLQSQVVAHDVKGCSDIIGGDGLTCAVVAYCGEQGAGDARFVTVFLVMTHQAQQVFIVVTGEGEITVIVTHEVA